jgi:hypothetical protein
MTAQPVDFMREKTVTPMGRITLHEVTKYGLHRIKIELGNTPPDTQMWADTVPAEYKVVLTDIEKHEIGGQTVYALWLYIKEVR